MKSIGEQADSAAARVIIWRRINGNKAEQQGIQRERGLKGDKKTEQQQG